MSAATFDSADAFEAIETYFENGWSDGLPVVPPRPEVVRRFIEASGRGPDEVLIEISQTNMQCTVEHAAINAVMAGCKAEYFPVVVAAVEGWADPRWGSTAFYMCNASTGSAGQLAVVSGPAGKLLGFNSGINVFGPGFRANATVGRALRLIIINALGMAPHVFDMASMGHPGKYSYCIAEDVEHSPWAPLHVDTGFGAEASTVTVVGARAPTLFDERSRDDSEGILDAAARVMQVIGGGRPIVLVLGVEHADIIGRRNGWTRQQVKDYLFEKTRQPVTAGRRRPTNVRTVDGVDYSYLVRVPEDILVVVAGAPNAGMSAVIPTWVYSVPPGQFISKQIVLQPRVAATH
ncbi:MAG TPA: hypothetical protein VFS62_02700 [Chloroflexota bacterium]|nr:hypothetical protein [Chloroflexota bacterium]